MTSFSSQESFFDFAAEIAALNRGTPLVEERFLVGDAFLVSRRLIEKIGTFDTDFFGYCGDADFGVRAQMAGFRVALARSAFAYHDVESNFRYQSPDQQNLKMERRRARVSDALRLIFRKYDLPLRDCTIHGIPWEDLGNQPFERSRHYVAPKDYSRFMLQP